MTVKYPWTRYDAGFVCEMPGNVTLVVTPTAHARGFVPKPARGARWHAQASHWSEATRCMSRFGRDEYGNTQASAKDAMRLAEDIYSAATLAA